MSPKIPNFTLLIRVTDFLSQFKYCEFYDKVEELYYKAQVSLLIHVCFRKLVKWYDFHGGRGTLEVTGKDDL